jgi:periplasmic protein TonB
MIVRNKVICSIVFSSFYTLFFVCGAFAKSPVSRVRHYDVKAIRDTIPENDTSDKVFAKVEIEASFSGGDAWRHFLEKNVNAAVPVDKKAPPGTYTVIVQFIVDKEGKVSDIKPLTKHGYGMEEEVVRILRKAPRWEPAVQDGRKVRAYRKQPVTFMVSEEVKKKKKDRT